MTQVTTPYECLRMTQLPALLTTEEVAEALRVHPNTVRQWVTAGRLAAIPYPGRSRRFRREDVDRLFDAQTSVPVQRTGAA